jgi:hypothetical protein
MNMLYKIRCFITHGGPFGQPDFFMTTRWHRVKCRVRSRYYRVRARIIDWWNEERYVPLVCNTRHEVRSWRVSALTIAGEPVITAQHWDGSTLHASLPPGVDYFEDLPQFKTSDACFDYARDAWPTLQA